MLLDQLAQRLACTQHDGALGQDDVARRAVDERPFVVGVPLLEVEPGARSHLGQHRHGALIEAHALFENRLLGHLEHGRLDQRIQEHAARGFVRATLAAPATANRRETCPRPWCGRRFDRRSLAGVRPAWRLRARLTCLARQRSVSGRARSRETATSRWHRPRVAAGPTRETDCICRPGPALTSMITPPCSSRGRPMSSAKTSMPATSNPTTRCRELDRARHLRMHVVGGRRSPGFRCAESWPVVPTATRCRACVLAARARAALGHWARWARAETTNRVRGEDRCFNCESINCPMVCRPSPTTTAGLPRTAATIFPPRPAAGARRRAPTPR